MYDVLGDFSKRAREIELTLKEGSIRHHLFKKTIDRINPSKVAAIQDHHRDRLTYFISGDAAVDRAGPEKYFDIPYFLATRTAPILELGLVDDTSSKNILDIGVGPGHFAAMCNALGHQTLGIDTECEFYPELCSALEVERRICPVYRLEKLPDFGKKFDLVTAIWICFDLIGEDARGHRIYWSLRDWVFLIEDLFNSHISDGGEVYFVLNMQVNKDGTTEYDSDLLNWAESVGATVNRQQGTIRLKKADYQHNHKPNKADQPLAGAEESKKKAS